MSLALPVTEGNPIPAPGPVFGEPPVDLTALLQPTDLYRVLSVNQITRFPPDGREIPTIDTVFTVHNDRNTHELYIDNYAFTHADPLSYLRGRAKRIDRLYALPTVLPPDPEEI